MISPTWRQETMSPAGRRPPRRITRAVWLALVVSILLARGAPAGSDSGHLDSSFGKGGKLPLWLPPTGDFGVDLAVQRDGKIVVLAGSWRPDAEVVVARVLPGGRLDRTFGERGKVRIGSRTNGDAHSMALALQPDGRILVSALVDRGQHHAETMLVRLLPEGGLDPSFGNGGRVRISFDGLYVFPESLLVTRDGKIVVGGPGYPHGDFSPSGSWATLARLHADGRRDTTFGRKGRLRVGPTMFGAAALAEQADGKLLIGGDPGLRRILDDGGLDPTFGEAGIVTTSRTDTDATAVAAIAIDANGRILTVGSNWAGNRNIVLTRHLLDGSFDPAFGEAGRVITDIAGSTGDHGNALAVAGDGRIVVAGYTTSDVDDITARHFAVVRYLPDGARDATFADQGVAVTHFGPYDSWANGVALQDDGRVLVCGAGAAKSTARVALARYLQ